MSRVKVGDLAIIKGVARLEGRIVEVLYPTSLNTPIRLPNGVCAEPDPQPGWVVKFVGGAARISHLDGSYRESLYATANDDVLYPLPGDPDTVDERYSDEVPA